MTEQALKLKHYECRPHSLSIDVKNTQYQSTDYFSNLPSMYARYYYYVRILTEDFLFAQLCAYFLYSVSHSILTYFPVIFLSWLLQAEKLKCRLPSPSKVPSNEEYKILLDGAVTGRECWRQTNLDTTNEDKGDIEGRAIPVHDSPM